MVGHIRGSCSLPWSRLPQSMHELPASHIPVALIGDNVQLQQAEQFLFSKGYTITESFLSIESFWQQVSAQGILEKGSQSVQLWQANPLLVEVIKLVETIISGRIAIDLACGAGRDSVYLASRGWQVTGIDNKDDALQRCDQLAKSNHVELATLLMDLENQSLPLTGFFADLVLVMRYLHRPLFPAIDRLIKPGGAIIYSTFMVGCEKFGAPCNPDYLLVPGELASYFTNYTIVTDQQRELPDRRPVALFVAIKK